MNVRAGTSAAATAFLHNDFHADFLQRELIVDRAEQIERTTFRHRRAMQFNPRILAGEFGMRFGQLAIEQKRNVCVELLLQLEELRLRIIPESRLKHHEEHFITLRVVRKKIDHPCPLQTGRCRGGRVGCTIRALWKFNVRFLSHGPRSYGRIVPFAIDR